MTTKRVLLGVDANSFPIALNFFANRGKFAVTVVRDGIEAFVDDLSNWYVRRNRRRFWKGELDDDKRAAYATLHEVLVTLVRVLAPFVPHLADAMWGNLVGSVDPAAPDSVHLTDYPDRVTGRALPAVDAIWGAAAGVALSVADAFIVDHLLKGWRPSQFIDDTFQSFLKLTAIHGACNQGTHVELQKTFVH